MRSVLNKKNIGERCKKIRDLYTEYVNSENEIVFCNIVSQTYNLCITANNDNAQVGMSKFDSAILNEFKVSQTTMIDWFATKKSLSKPMAMRVANWCLSFVKQIEDEVNERT